MIPRQISREVIYENEWVSLYADKLAGILNLSHKTL